MQVGSKVKLQTADGQFGGIMFAMNRQQQYVTLCHVFDPSTGEKYRQPVLNFFMSQIRKCDVVKTDTETGETTTKRSKFSSGLLMELGLKEPCGLV